LHEAPRKELTLFDSTCLIMGIIIGAGLYRTAPDVARGAGCLWGVLALWALGGMLSLFGAFGYAELASAYPREGGDYVYLNRAYGPWAGFLFGWIQLAIVRPGDIAVMAFAFATFARGIWDPLSGSDFSFADQIYACSVVALFTAINIAGVKESKWTQNILTMVKALGLLAIVGVALFAPLGTESRATFEPFPLSIALIYVLFAFGGWNEMAYVAAEVKNPERNIVRALVLGTLAVTVLYLMVNGAFLYTLGFTGLATAGEEAATKSISTVLPHVGERLISALICISALGAVNGLIFTGARISYAVGSEHRAFRILGRWNPRTGTPAWALLVQGTIALVLILVLGSFFNSVIYTAAAVYTFYLATSLAVIVLRRKDPRVRRPYRVTGYPFTTIIFCAVCAFLIYSAVDYALKNMPWTAAISYILLPLGLPIYWITSRRGRRTR